MTAELVFNELSLGRAPAQEAARRAMLALVRTCFLAQTAGAGRVLLVPEGAVNSEIGPDYSLWNWVNDPLVDLDWRRKFLSMATHGPFTEKVLSAEILERLAISEYSLAEQTALGLGAAHVLDGLAVSVGGEEGWHEASLRLDLLSLSDDGDLLTDQVEVRHAASPDHVEGHRPWLSAQQLAQIGSGEALWRRRGALYPALAFCPRVEAHIAALGPRDPHLRQVQRKLGQLNDAFAAWRDGPFARGSIPDCDPESRATLQQFKAEHSFLCPDGKTRLFSWHLALTPGAWRLFFKPDKETRKAIVGHIGPKLPNVKYAT